MIVYVTRAYKRLELLHKCIMSVWSQRSRCWEQYFIPDPTGHNIQWANQQFYEHRDKISKSPTDYVALLDDDCALVDPQFTWLLHEYAEANDYPQVIAARTIRPQLYPFILPPDPDFRAHELHKSRMNAGCLVTRADVWYENCYHYGWPPTVAGAWQYPAKLMEQDLSWGWLNVVWIKTMILGRGRNEVDASLPANWWDKHVRPDFPMMTADNRIEGAFLQYDLGHVPDELKPWLAALDPREK
ncbi:MAG: hypothetical protein ACYTDW_03180 [Planctomycetota bacterium]